MEKTAKTTRKRSIRKKVTRNSKNSKTVFPNKELDNWLSNRKFWNHDDWLLLLDNLKSLGFTDLVDKDYGRTEIGNYLEKNRMI